MAKNPNPSLPNRHTFYSGVSGSGKSQALKQNPDFPKTGVRCLIWDHSNDHAKGTRYYSNKNQFIDAVKKAVKSGKGFRIGWNGESDPAAMEWFCAVAWAILDGGKPTYIILEELAAAVETVGRASPNMRRLFNEGRKYGAVLHPVTQRPQEIPKTVYDMCAIFWVGMQKNTNIKKFSGVIDVPESDIKSLTNLEFYHYDETSGQPARRVQLKYKK
ncbi:hypothetical protein [Bacterioplanoides sp.]|uniref:hypothetical protein n=1 Tax=Bacterioplanoides sp. TaxID=2066072 RepID=UPI003AFF8C68